MRIELSFGRIVGSKIYAPPDGLQFYGPIVRVKIGIHPHLAKLFKEKSRPIPSPIEGDAIIDSGATVTCVDHRIIDSLGIKPTGKTMSVGIGGTEEALIVACSLQIREHNFWSPHVRCHDLKKVAKGLVALIGRDLLRGMVFHYDGRAGTAYLDLPDPPKPKKSAATVRRKRKH